jgi:hypothetical protein
MRPEDRDVNVVITTDSYLPRLGGQEMGAFRLVKYLRRKGHQVRIITTEKHPWSGPEEGGFEVVRAPHRFGLADDAQGRQSAITEVTPGLGNDLTAWYFVCTI